MKSLPALLAISALTSACTVTVESQSEIIREERRFSVSGRTDVRLSTFDGAIQIQSWDKPEVLIEIEKRGPTKESVESIDIVATQSGNVIDLEVKRPRRESLRGIGISRTAYARLYVWVPAATDVRARSGDGSIQIERVNGRIDLRTGDGRIRAVDVAGDLTFATGDGSVVIDGAEGRLNVDTGDGSVNVAGKLEAVRLHTGDGSVALRAASGAAMVEDWEITTGDGSVSLFLPADFNARIDAHTGDGRISNDLNVERADDDVRPRRRLRGVLGEGGKLIRVRTGDGSIRLKSN